MGKSDSRPFQWTILVTLCCLLALCLAAFPLSVTTADPAPGAGVLPTADIPTR